MIHANKTRLPVRAVIVGLALALAATPAPVAAHHEMGVIAHPCVGQDSGKDAPRLCLNITTGDFIRILNIVHEADVEPGEVLLFAQSVLLTDFNGNSVLSMGVGEDNGCEMYEAAEALLDCDVIPLVNETVTERSPTAKFVGVCLFEARYSATLDGQEILGVNATRAGFCDPGDALVST